MTHLPPDEDDVSLDPSLETGKASVPFEYDPYWIEAPGSNWSPEFEHSHMPIRKPTPAELADTERKRGSSEDETCPVDPLLENLDFTSEYISPKEQDKLFKEALQEHYEHIRWDEEDEDLKYIDWDGEEEL